MKGTIVVQLFLKQDMIESVFNNLLELKDIENYNIVFYQDNIKNSSMFFDDNEKNNSKFTYIQDFIQTNIYKLKNAIYFCNDKNEGVYETLRKLMLYSSNETDFIIFCEDDVILSNECITFFQFFYDNNMISSDLYPFICGESIFFNNENVSDNQKNEIVNEINLHNRYQSYYETDFVHSSCFATTKLVWDTFSHIRCSINGDICLNKHVKEHNIKIVNPFIPLCIDKGMLHSDGYSCVIHGRENISELKNHFITIYDFINKNIQTFELIKELDYFYDRYNNLNM